MSDRVHFALATAAYGAVAAASFWFHHPWIGTLAAITAAVMFIGVVEHHAPPALPRPSGPEPLFLLFRAESYHGYGRDPGDENDSAPEVWLQSFPGPQRPRRQVSPSTALPWESLDAPERRVIAEILDEERRRGS